MQLDSPRSPLGRVCTNTHTQKTDRQASTQAHTEDRQAHRQTDTQKTDKHIDTHTHKCTHTHTHRYTHTEKTDRQIHTRRLTPILQLPVRTMVSWTPVCRARFPNSAATDVNTSVLSYCSVTLCRADKPRLLINCKASSGF